MKPKVFEKQKAIEMRTKGFSLNEIQTNLKVSKASVSLWVRNVLLTEKAKTRLLQRSKDGMQKSRASKIARTTQRLREAEEFAKEVLVHIPRTKNHSRLFCALLYWCEGEKSKHDQSLIFTNSDPLLAKSFLDNLRFGFDIDESKFRVCVHLHDYHNRGRQMKFWSDTTDIPLRQFIKPHQKANSGVFRKIGYEGCASVRYHDVRIARQVQALARAFLNKGL